MQRINIDSASFYLEESIGSQRKKWIVMYMQKYLFKETTIKSDGTSTYNDIAECLAYGIGRLIGISCAEYYLCSLRGINGIITPDFLDNTPSFEKKEELISGTSLISRIDPNFKNMSLVNPKTHQYYTVSLVLDSVLEYGFVKEALEMLVFDSLIGNEDRNPSNYGIIINHESGKKRFAPLYDNAKSLGISMVDHRLRKCYNVDGEMIDQLHTDTVMHHHIVGKITLERQMQYKEKNLWDIKETTRILGMIEQRKRELSTLLEKGQISQFEYHKQLYEIGNQYRKYDITTIEYRPLIEYLTTYYSNYIEDIVLRIKENINEENIENLFSQYSNELPPDRMEFAKKMVLERANWIVTYFEENKERNRGKLL